MGRGQLLDTYIAALQHGLVDLPADTWCIGVVRRPTPWLHGQVDTNYPALAPPGSLLTDMKNRQAALEEHGLDEVTAHNRAMVDVDYRRRYRCHLERSDAATERIGEIRNVLTEGTNVALVCFENTDEKRCHRTDLRNYIRSTESD